MQVFEINKELDPAIALQVMSLLAKGTFRSDAPDFPPADWPERWWSQHAGRYLDSDDKSPSAPNRFVLSLRGCGCWQRLVLEYGSSRTQSKVAIVSHKRLCA